MHSFRGLQDSKKQKQKCIMKTFKWAEVEMLSHNYYCVTIDRNRKGNSLFIMSLDQESSESVCHMVFLILKVSTLQQQLVGCSVGQTQPDFRPDTWQVGMSWTGHPSSWMWLIQFGEPKSIGPRFSRVLMTSGIVCECF